MTPRVRRRPAPAPGAGATASRPAGPRARARGWPGRGGGASPVLAVPDTWRATSVQACGLWPFAAGTGSPVVGVPLGRHLTSGATVCCDPISWFQRAKLIANPSCFVLSKPGLGKSTIVRRMALGLAGYGAIPLVLGDLKPDYVDLVEALGGQVVPIGPGRGHLNVLDPGQAHAAADRLVGTARSAVLADAHSRRLTMTAALITLLRSSPPTDREETLLDRALRVLDDRHPGVPLLGDLLQVVRDAPEDLRAVAIDHGDLSRYRAITEGLEASLVGLLGSGRLGETFARPTTRPMDRDRPVVFDVSGVDDAQSDLQAASLLACWSAGFSNVNIAHALADAGLEPRRHYFVVLDELWRALRAGKGMVDRVDALTRLNRQRGVGMAMISHTMSDLLALPDEADRMKARGFVERAGMVVCGGLPAAEMPLLRSAVPFSGVEEDMLVSWQDPPVWDPDTGVESAPPGRGNFLVKVGGRPGIPVHVELSATERDLALHDTNKMWHTASRLGRLADPAPTPDGPPIAAASALPIPRPAVDRHTPAALHGADGGHQDEGLEDEGLPAGAAS